MNNSSEIAEYALHGVVKSQKKFFFSKMRNRIKRGFQCGVEKLTGHNIRHVNSFTELVKFMYTPVDGSSLAIGRILFG